ncbi:MAG: carboxypeptidase-like regulatory domain-containing protein [Planctomycetota bacterium]
MRWNRLHSLSSFLLVALWPAVVPSCSTGDGSDIGPKLDKLATSFLAGLVVDQDGLPISGARITLEGSQSDAVSGRNGRFFFELPPVGTVRMAVNGAAATADASDRFPELSLRVSIPPGKTELDRPIVLPDLGSGGSLSVPLGASTGFALAAGAPPSATLKVGNGAVLSRPSASGNVTLGVTKVDSEELPLELATASTRLGTRGIWLTPTDLGFSGSVSLSIPNDLGLPVGQKAELYRLDAGVWSLVGPGTVQAVQGGGTEIVMDQAVLPGGGLYVFTKVVGATTSLSGRVLDGSMVPVPGALVVSALGKSTRCDAGGAFTLGPLPAVDGGNASVNLPVLLVAPLGFEPARALESVVATAGVTSVGDRSIDALRSGMVRVLGASRGFALVERRFMIGSGSGGSHAIETTDSSGVLRIRDMPAGVQSAHVTWVDGQDFFRGLVRAELMAGQESLDLLTIAGREDPRGTEWRGNLLGFVLDELSGAPVQDAVFQGKHDPLTQLTAVTDRVGSFLAAGERFGQPTASARTSHGGRTVTAAFTLDWLDNSRAEFPLQTARRSRMGSFDPHALLAGSLLATTAGKTHKLLVRPIYRENDLWNRILTGQSFAGDLPRHTDPELSGQNAYRVGLPRSRSFVTAVEGVLSSGVFVPEKLGFLVDLVARAGDTVNRDLGLDFPVDRSLVVQSVLSGRDADIPDAALRYELGLRRSDGSTLDLLTESGGVLAGTDDLTIRVPARTGVLANGSFLVAVGGSGTRSSGATITQHLYFEAVGPSVAPGPFLAVPEISSPSPGQSVAASGFTASWSWAPSSPPDYFLLELSSVDGSDDHYWTVMLRGEARSFDFKSLVATAPQVLTTGRSWTLVLQAFRLTRGIAVDRADGYQRLIGNLYSIRPGDRGIGARSSFEISISTP